MKRYGKLALLLALCLLLLQPGPAGAEGPMPAHPNAQGSSASENDGPESTESDAEQPVDQMKVSGPQHDNGTDDEEPDGPIDVILRDQISIVYGDELELTDGIENYDSIVDREALLATLKFAVVKTEGEAEPKPPKDEDDYISAAEAKSERLDAGKYRVYVRSSDEKKCKIRAGAAPTEEPEDTDKESDSEDIEIADRVSELIVQPNLPTPQGKNKNGKKPTPKPAATPKPTPTRKPALTPKPKIGPTYYDLTIEQAKVTFILEAVGEATYDPTRSSIEIPGKANVADTEGASEDTLRIALEKTGTNDEEGLFAKLSESVADVELGASGKEAGSYPVDKDGDVLKECVEKLQDALGDNFAVDAKWGDGEPKLEIEPLAATVKLNVAGDGKPYAVYHEGRTLSFADAPQSITSPDVDIDLMKEIPQVHLTNNELDAVGVLSSEDVHVEYDDKNYDLTVETGKKLVMFRQSIDPADIMPDDPGEDTEKAYYDGITVKLNEELSEYDGNKKSVEVEVIDEKGQDCNGNVKKLVEGPDYSVRFEDESGAECEIIDAGKYKVVVTGEGNYGGTVELDYEVSKRPFNVDGVEIAVGEYEYNGAAQGPRRADVRPGTPDEIKYRRADDTDEEWTDEPFSDAGSYMVKAIWSEDDNNEGGESEPVEYEIRPLPLEIDLDADGRIVKMSKGAGLETVEEGTAEWQWICEQLGITSGALTDAQMGENAQWPTANFAVNVKFNEPISFVDGNTWVYDGQKASRKIQTTRDENLVFYRVSDEGEQRCVGDEADGPKDVGDYYVTLARTVADAEAPKVYFHIEPLKVAPGIALTETGDIKFGDPLPVWDIKVEAAESGATISEELRKEIRDEIRNEWILKTQIRDEARNEWILTDGGEAGAGSYRYILSAPDEGGSGNFEYTLNSVEVSFEVAPQALEAAGVEMSDVSAEAVADESAQRGEIAEARDDIAVRNGKGEELERGRDYELYELNAPVDAALDALLVVGTGNYAGTIRLSWRKSLAMRLFSQGGPYLAVALVLLLGAVGCGVAAARLKGRIKRDSLKLLDKVSRQSRRTIRRGR